MMERISRQIWNLPASFPKAGLHALLDEVGLNIPSVWEDYCGAAIRSWTQILNDEGALGTTARASLQRASTMFRYWPLELAFHSRKNAIHRYVLPPWPETWLHFSWPTYTLRVARKSGPVTAFFSPSQP